MDPSATEAGQATLLTQRPATEEKPQAAPQPAPQPAPLSGVPAPVRGIAFFCKQFWKRIWQFVLYAVFVVPPSIATGIMCATLLYCIKLATALRNGTCGTNGFDAFVDTEHPLIACTNVVGAKRWLFFLLSFSGMFVAFLYTYVGNASAAGGMNTILISIRKLEQEINRVSDEHKAREASGQPPVHQEPSEEYKGLVALRMCPLVWIGTVSTHLCGGAAGREGSALQMAAPIFSKYTDFLDQVFGKINPHFRMTVQMRRASLVAAIAAGFAGIFGVPVTGAIFAVEVLRVGEITIGEMLQPAIVGAFVADWACRIFNARVFAFEGHSHYQCDSCQNGGQPQAWGTPGWGEFINFTELVAIVPAAIAFGLAGYAFEWLLHHFKDIFGKLAGRASGGNATLKTLLTPFIGGWVVVLMWLVLCAWGSTSSFNLDPNYDGTSQRESTFAQAFLGLSVYEPGQSISSCFVKREAGLPLEYDVEGVGAVQIQPIMWYSFALKLLFTTVTLGAGFKGGEVTPIFFIGAALGNVCGWALGQDTQLFSALGLVSVFAAAANTPIACTFMAVELFGGAKVLPYLLSCYIAYLVSNTEKVNGIYAAQEKPHGGPTTVTPFSRRAPHRV